MNHNFEEQENPDLIELKGKINTLKDINNLTLTLVTGSTLELIIDLLDSQVRFPLYGIIITISFILIGTFYNYDRLDICGIILLYLSTFFGGVVLLYIRS